LADFITDNQTKLVLSRVQRIHALLPSTRKMQKNHTHFVDYMQSPVMLKVLSCYSATFAYFSYVTGHYTYNILILMHVQGPHITPPGI